MNCSLFFVLANYSVYCRDIEIYARASCAAVLVLSLVPLKIVVKYKNIGMLDST